MISLQRFQAMLLVFTMSAVLHEYMVSVPLRMFKAYAFFGMALQVDNFSVNFYQYIKILRSLDVILCLDKLCHTKT